MRDGDGNTENVPHDALDDIVEPINSAIPFNEDSVKKVTFSEDPDIYTGILLLSIPENHLNVLFSIYCRLQTISFGSSSKSKGAHKSLIKLKIMH